MQEVLLKTCLSMKCFLHCSSHETRETYWGAGSEADKTLVAEAMNFILLKEFNPWKNTYYI